MGKNLFDGQTNVTINKGIPAIWKVYDVPTLFTVGYEGKSIDFFIGELLDNRISAVVDVRYNPLSRKRGFSKAAFRTHLENNGIRYYHIKELGVPSLYRRNLHTEESYRVLFDYYASNILPSNMASIGKLKQLIDEFKRLALACFEADYLTCHRHIISDFLSRDVSSDELKITHL
jgi:uncharacterized protein (DUF488 family)